MNDFLIYMARVATSMMVFYFFFLLFLKKDTSFGLNRLYLTGTFLLSFVLPFSAIRLFQVVPDNDAVLYSLLLEPARITGTKIGEGLEASEKIRNLLLVIYSAVTLFFLTRLTISIISTIHLRNSGQKTNKYGIKILITSRLVKPFTFMRTIVISRKDAERDDLYQILLHEQIHAKKLHTVDLIFTEIIKSVCWFNPFVYLYQRSLREIHEYQADSAIIKKGHDSFSYQQLILNQLFNTKNIQFSNFFNYSLTKKRITMITKEKTSKYTTYKVLMVLPLAFLIAIGFGCAKDETGTKGTANLYSNDSIVKISKNNTAGSNAESNANNSAEEEVFFIVEEMPKFEGGGPDKFREYIGSHLQYPEVAAQNGISGRVFVQFDVNSQGKVTNAKVVRGVDPALDKEALRVVNGSPDWEPGMQRGHKVSVRFTFPINFALK